VRIVVADDSLLLREGIARILEAAGHEVVGFAANGVELIDLVAKVAPDVAIIDIRMPPTQTDEGLRAATTLREIQGPRLGLLILSQHVEAAYAQQVLTDMAGGSGYLLKERVAEGRVLADAVVRVAAGEVVVDPEIVAQLLRKRARGPLSDLTAREIEVLALVAEGRSNQAISDQLAIADKTVETHINAIFSKLGLEPAAEDNRRVLAVLSYLRGRMVTR
jgi:DNA-binding NarL/FixJ family response regulator